MSVQSTMELNGTTQCQKCADDYQSLHVLYMAVIAKDQMAKTVVKVLYERFITVFGAPAKLMSDRGANFTSALVEELCAAFGIQKCQTTANHAQCNGQLEWFHQTLFRMIGKLAMDKKVQWEQHLPELLQAYNSARSVVTGYSLHYLIFGRCPHLPVDFYFPTRGAHVCSYCVTTYIEEVRRHFKEASAEAYYDRVTSTMPLMLGDLVLMKLDAFQGKRKVKDRWSKAEYVVMHQVADDVLAYEM